MSMKGVMGAVAALSLLSGSAAAAATTGAQALSLNGSIRAGAPTSGDESKLGGSSVLIGIAIFAAIVAIIYVVADDDPATSP